MLRCGVQKKRSQVNVYKSGGMIMNGVCKVSLDWVRLEHVSEFKNL